MQTFLPERGFAASARALDRQRLGKQRVEAKQIMLALENPAYGWQNHPAVKMWRRDKLALAQYGVLVCREWRSRGYQDSLLPFFTERTPDLEQGWTIIPPEWLTDEFCLAHRSNLIRKLPAHYAPLWPGVPSDLPYIWPVE